MRKFARSNDGKRKQFEHSLKCLSPNLLELYKKFLEKRTKLSHIIPARKKYYQIVQNLNNDLDKLLHKLVVLMRKIPDHVWNYLAKLCLETADLIYPNARVRTLRCLIRLRAYTIHKLSAHLKHIDFSVI